MEFTAIDFETATGRRNSACAFGIAVIEGGEVVERQSWLIQPPENEYFWFNIGVHGISAETTINEPDFGMLWPEISPFLEGRLIVAHNAPFDMGVLAGSLDYYGLGYPRFDYLCTVGLSRHQWPELPNHRLATVADFLRISFNHHDASDDAYASALIAATICRECGCANLLETSQTLSVRPRHFGV